MSQPKRVRLLWLKASYSELGRPVVVAMKNRNQNETTIKSGLPIGSKKRSIPILLSCFPCTARLCCFTLSYEQHRFTDNKASLSIWHLSTYVCCHANSIFSFKVPCSSEISWLQTHLRLHRVGSWCCSFRRLKFIVHKDKKFKLILRWRESPTLIPNLSGQSFSRVSVGRATSCLCVKKTR